MSELSPGASSRATKRKPAPNAKSTSNGKPDPLQDLLHALQAMRAAKAHDGQAVDVKAPVMAEYNRQLQQDLVGSSWAGSCSSWYKTADGRITNNWSGSVEDYRARCATFDLSEYELIRQDEPASV